MSTAIKRTILLFTRAPEAEARAKQLPVDAGSRLFEALLGGWRERAEQTHAELLVVAPAQSLAVMRRLLPSARIAAQEGASFGERLEAAFSFAFGHGADSVLMAGGDCPPLVLAEVEAAFAHLAGNRPALALAPAEDGGVNLIGFNASADRNLSHIHWLSSDVDRQLRETALASGLSLWLSASSPDLDRARDVAALYRRSRVASLWGSFRSFLRQMLLVAAANVRYTIELPRSVFLESRVTRGPPRSLLLSH